MTVQKTLAEIALRTERLDAMQAFYADVVQLELIRRFETSAFFKVSDGLYGHTNIVAIFDRSNDDRVQPVDQARTTVDHIALSIALEDFEPEKWRLLALGLEMHESTHAWVQWRSLYVRDPDGNMVEWVAFDRSIECE